MIATVVLFPVANLNVCDQPLVSVGAPLGLLVYLCIHNLCSTGTLTITNSTVLNGIKNGTIKGFGIRSTYDSSHYAVCSGNVTVKITYTE